MKAIIALHRTAWVTDSLFPFDVSSASLLGLEDQMGGSVMLPVSSGTLQPCRIRVEQKELGFATEIWAQLPLPLPRQYSSTFSDGWGHLSFELEWVAALPLTEESEPDLPFPCSVRVLKESKEDLLRLYQCDNSAKILVKKSTNTMASPFSDPKKAATFAEYFLKTYGVKCEKDASLWVCVVPRKRKIAPGKLWTHPVELPTELLQHTAPELGNRQKIWTLQHLPQFLFTLRHTHLHQRLGEVLSIKNLPVETLVPASCQLSHSLERLEFLGDAVLKLVASKWLYRFV